MLRPQVLVVKCLASGRRQAAIVELVCRRSAKTGGHVSEQISILADRIVRAASPGVHVERFIAAERRSLVRRAGIEIKANVIVPPIQRQGPFLGGQEFKFAIERIDRFVGGIVRQHSSSRRQNHTRTRARPRRRCPGAIVDHGGVEAAGDAWRIG